MKKEHRLNTAQLAEWLLEHHRAEVIAALGDLVGQAMERRNDERRTGKILSARPELQEWVNSVRDMADMFGISTWFLLNLNGTTFESCCDAALLISELRAEENKTVTESLRPELERLETVGDGNMTVGEARRELERRANETIRGLEEEAR
jgi:hypothetical protein